MTLRMMAAGLSLGAIAAIGAASGAAALTPDRAAEAPNAVVAAAANQASSRNVIGYRDPSATRGHLPTPTGTGERTKQRGVLPARRTTASAPAETQRGVIPVSRGGRALLHHLEPRAERRGEHARPEPRHAVSRTPVEIRRLGNRFLHHSGKRVDSLRVARRALPVIEPEVQVPAGKPLCLVFLRHRPCCSPPSCCGLPWRATQRRTGCAHHRASV